MQKWEYCAVGPIDTGSTRGDPTEGVMGMLFAPTTARFPGPAYQATLVFMKREGLTPPRAIDSPDDLARTVAALGDDGWELVGCGTRGNHTGFDKKDLRLEHFLYFKRPKE